MKRKNGIYTALTLSLFALFAIFTLLLCVVDRAPVWPLQEEVGFAHLNVAVREAVGQNDVWYQISEYMLPVAAAVAFAFFALGVYQIIRRKSLWRVDPAILSLAVIYALVVAFYVLFEIVVINYRPVLTDGVLEASYPSTHTLLVCVLMATAPIALGKLTERRALKLGGIVVAAIVVPLTVVARMLSGVHWFTDIIGGLLLSATLVAAYPLCYGLVARFVARLHANKESK